MLQIFIKNKYMKNKSILFLRMLAYGLQPILHQRIRLDSGHLKSATLYFQRSSDFYAFGIIL